MTPCAVLLFAGLALPLRAQQITEPGTGEPIFTLKEWTQKLGLSQAQIGPYDALLKERAEKLDPLRRRFRVLVAQLRAQVEAKASDAELEATLDELMKARLAIIEERNLLAARSKAFLSPLQRAKALLAVDSARRAALARGAKGAASKP